MAETSLPEELVLLISENAAHEPQTLYSLSLVSQTFRRLAQPLLYRRYQRFGSTHASNKTKLFLRTLLEKPAYASLVREVAFNHWKTRGEYDSIRRMGRVVSMQQPSEELIALYNGHIFPPSSQYPSLGPAIRDLRLGSEDAEVLLLLLLCPNISSLEIVMWWDDAEQSYVKDFIQELCLHASNPVEPAACRMLSKLESLRVEHTRNLDEIHKADAFAHLLHPALTPQLKHLDAHDFFLDKMCVASRLTEIRFTESSWTTEDVEALLHNSPHLQVLHLEATDNKQFIEVYPLPQAPDLPRIGNALRKFGTSLRSLTFDTSKAIFRPNDFRPEQNPVPQEGLPLGSLQTLTKLEYLRLSSRQLLSSPPKITAAIYRMLQDEVLPKSCKQVDLIWDAPTEFSRGWVGNSKLCIMYQGRDEGGERMELKLHLCRGRSGRCTNYVYE